MGAITTGTVAPLWLSDPDQIDGYTLTGRLGSGGTATVYLAHSPEHGDVALKVMHPDLPDAAVAVRTEFQLMRRAGSRHVVRVFDHGDSGDGAYLAMAYLPRYAPMSALRSGMDIPTLWRLAYATARAIAATHAADVIHCDVKPSNLLTHRGDVRLIDFGIARDMYAQVDAGDPMVRCSRGWAAPEQLSKGPLTPAVDVFAWGCLVAYLADGVHPFASSSLPEWVLRVRTSEPDIYHVPAGLEPLVRAALSRNPSDRPTAWELASACRDNAVWRARDGRERRSAPVEVLTGELSAVAAG
ncbi:MAG TPA: serine/threonine-protein kinase [Micromonosporaceae bacterium]|nr:serine/threonine-protein kinase [Micromonosporaceae bacterium]